MQSFLGYWGLGQHQRQRGRYDTAWHQQERVEAAEATGIALSIHPAVLAWFLR